MIFRFCSAAKRTRCRSGFILADWARSCSTSALIGVEVGDWDADSDRIRFRTGTGKRNGDQGSVPPIGTETTIELQSGDS